VKRNPSPSAILSLRDRWRDLAVQNYKAIFVRRVRFHFVITLKPIQHLKKNQIQHIGE